MRTPVRGVAGPVTLGIVVGSMACVGVLSSGPPEGRHRIEPVDRAGAFVGAESCRDCHASFEGHFMTSAEHGDCESCHGPGQRHTLTARPLDVRFPSSDDCLACHAIGHSAVPGWSSSPHRSADVLCSDCHDTHNRAIDNLREVPAVRHAVLRQASPTTLLCADCHVEVVGALNLPSHHPVGEGMMDCTDCHDPHQDRRDALGARTDACTDCHEDQGGPWIFEHPPVAEDCAYCHTPHGSSTYDLLVTTQPGVCIGCHTVAESGAVHDPFAFVTRCTDCHGAVHGSYADPHLLR